MHGLSGAKTKALLEHLREGADIPHAGEPLLAQDLGGGLMALAAVVEEVAFQAVGKLVSEAFSDPVHKLGVIGQIPIRRPLRDFHEDVEVIGPDAARKDTEHP